MPRGPRDVLGSVDMTADRTLENALLLISFFGQTWHGKKLFAYQSFGPNGLTYDGFHWGPPHPEPVDEHTPDTITGRLTAWLEYVGQGIIEVRELSR